MDILMELSSEKLNDAIEKKKNININRLVVHKIIIYMNKMSTLNSKFFEHYYV